MTLRASITELRPSRLWLLRLICRLIGATLKTWRARPRRKAVG
jgi:hypothetical protein